jgi:hypothetical protein
MYYTALYRKKKKFSDVQKNGFIPRSKRHFRVIKTLSEHFQVILIPDLYHILGNSSIHGLVLNFNNTAPPSVLGEEEGGWLVNNTASRMQTMYDRSTEWSINNLVVVVT